MEHSAEKWALLQLAGPGRGRLLAIGETPSTMGRGTEADLRVADTQASRRHAVLTPGADGVRLKDLESANGTFVDGERITETKLGVGDSFAIGQSLFYSIKLSEFIPSGNSIGVWEIKSLLGLSAVSWRYRARQKILERDVELEVLRENFTGDAELLEFYRSVLRRTASRNDPGIVPVFDLTEEDGRFLVARRLTVRRPIPWPTLNLRERAARIVEFFEVLLRWFERGMTVPLGLDRLTIGSDDKLHLSFPAALDLYLLHKRLHTRIPEYFPYVSPEDLAGGARSGREESYRLGALLFTAMTGEPPRQGKTRDALEHALSQPTPDARDLVSFLPAQAAQLMARLLSRHPQSRPTVQEAAEEWSAIAFPARQVTAEVERGPRPVRSRAVEAAPRTPAAPAAATRRGPRAQPQGGLGALRRVLFIALEVGLFLASSQLVYWLLGARFS